MQTFENKRLPETVEMKPILNECAELATEDTGTGKCKSDTLLGRLKRVFCLEF
jgi:hypothetical protein